MFLQDRKSVLRVDGTGTKGAFTLCRSAAGREKAQGNRGEVGEGIVLPETNPAALRNFGKLGGRQLIRGEDWSRIGESALQINCLSPNFPSEEN